MATKTQNFGMMKDAGTDYYNIDTANSNLDKIDAALSNTAKFETTGGTANAITLSGIALENGRSKTFIIGSSNNGTATTINGKPLYKPGTTSAPKLSAGKAVTIWYDAAGECFFIKASADGDAVAENVLAGKTFSNNDDTGIYGSMTDNGPLAAETINLTNDGAEYAIPKGYHSGLRKIKSVISGLTANVIKAGTKVGGITGTFTADATATAADIIATKTAGINGAMVPGSLPNKKGGTLAQGASGNIVSVSDFGSNAIGHYGYVKFKMTEEAAVDRNTTMTQTVFGVNPAVVKKGHLIGFDGSGVYGTLEDSQLDFPLSIQEAQPTPVRNGHIWIKSNQAASITKVKIVEAINAGEANGTIMIVVGEIAYHNRKISESKALTSGGNKTVEMADNNGGASWLAQYKDANNFTYLPKPIAIYSKLGGVLDIETSYMWDGSKWVMLSQKGSYALVASNSSTTPLKVYNINSDVLRLNASFPETSTKLYSNNDGRYMVASRPNGTSVYKRTGDVYANYFTIPMSTTIAGLGSYQLTFKEATITQDGIVVAIYYYYLDSPNSYIGILTYADNGSAMTQVSSYWSNEGGISYTSIRAIASVGANLILMSTENNPYTTISFFKSGSTYVKVVPPNMYTSPYQYPACFSHDEQWLVYYNSNGSTDKLVKLQIDYLGRKYGTEVSTTTLSDNASAGTIPVAHSGGYILLQDTNNRRVGVYRLSDLGLVGSISFPQSISKNGIAVDANGARLLTISNEDNDVRLYSLNIGTSSATISPLSTIAHNSTPTRCVLIPR